MSMLTVARVGDSHASRPGLSADLFPTTPLRKYILNYCKASNLTQTCPLWKTTLTGVPWMMARLRLGLILTRRSQSLNRRCRQWRYRLPQSLRLRCHRQLALQHHPHQSRRLLPKRLSPVMERMQWWSRHREKLTSNVGLRVRLGFR